MINATTDKVINFTQAAKICPKIAGKQPSTVTMWRWATKGVRGVKLEHVRVGRYMVTTEDALNEFFRGVANARAAQQVPQTSAPAVETNRANTPSEKQREREIASAKARLIARGMLPKETEH